jgi:hypothetical protein
MPVQEATILDRYGNNAAVVCVGCNGSFVVSELVNKKNGRICPHCGKSKVYFGVNREVLYETSGSSIDSLHRVREILAMVKPLAAEFYRLTNKPLGVTGEIAEFMAAELLGLTLTPARTVGFDALRGKERIQIKGRALGISSKSGHRMSQIKLDAPCDTVLLVLLDNASLELREIWEAPYQTVCDELCKPGSKARARGSLGVPAFKRIAKKVWPSDSAADALDRH